MASRSRPAGSGGLSRRQAGLGPLSNEGADAGDLRADGVLEGAVCQEGCMGSSQIIKQTINTEFQKGTGEGTVETLRQGKSLPECRVERSPGKCEEDRWGPGRCAGSCPGTGRSRFSRRKLKSCEAPMPSRMVLERGRVCVFPKIPFMTAEA